ncbi:MAG: hypothetical protein JW709_14025 [Sedimentisphaerales bacterium]|nr:hypothetical protein [Sedimentisphaerales bacterium]
MDQDLLEENGLVIVTGTNVHAERYDRPLAYRLKDTIEEDYAMVGDFSVVVMSDLWYLNAEPLRRLPTISLGRPGVNAVGAHLLKRLPHVLAVDNALLIQLDPAFVDLRASVWGTDHSLTVNATDLFVKKGYLKRFLEGAVQRFQA